MSTSLSLSKLSNAELLFQTKNLVAEERKVLTQVLDHLAEVYRRRLFAGLGYSSLYDYAVRELGYSEAAAQRRVASVQLMQELPEIRGQVESGALSLSAVAQAQTFFRKEKTVKADKRSILRKLEHQSSRQCERTLISLSANPEAYQRPDRVRPVSETHSEVRFTASDALLEDLEAIRGFLAHRKPHLSMAELIHEMARIALDQLDPARKSDRRKSERKRPERKPEVLEMGPAVERESALGLAESGDGQVGDGQVKKKTEPKTSTPASEPGDENPKSAISADMVAMWKGKDERPIAKKESSGEVGSDVEGDGSHEMGVDRSTRGASRGMCLSQAKTMPTASSPSFGRKKLEEVQVEAVDGFVL